MPYVAMKCTTCGATYDSRYHNVKKCHKCGRMTMAHVEPGDAQEEMARMGAFESQDEAVCSPNGFGLCVTHPTCEHVKSSLQEAQNKIADQNRELKARREILDTLQKACGEGSWLGCADWQKRLRDYASDSEQHIISRAAWKRNRGNGINLYSSGGFFTAYFDDAMALWGQADDTRPMFHVMVESDPPHRTVIHPLHLVEWVEHLAEMCLPVQILNGDDLNED